MSVILAKSKGKGSDNDRIVWGAVLAGISFINIACVRKKFFSSSVVLHCLSDWSATI